MRFPFFTCLFACGLLAYGQARNNNWVFANKWLSFNNGTTALLPLAYQPSFRNACISDTAGNFLLLVDDRGIRDNAFGLMPSGTSSDLGYNGEQGNYLVLPEPGDPQGYVVLVNSREDLKRAGAVEVDMSLNAGLGAVSAPMQWYMDSTTAKLAATPHGNGTDYWILQHEDGTDEFQAYQLTTTGVDPTPVISHVGTLFQPSDTSAANADFWGPMKFNMQGDMIAMVNMDPFATDTATEIQLFSFDDLSGTVTLLASIDHRYTELLGGNPVVLYNYQRQTGGVEFDALGGHLYFYTWDTVPPSDMSGFWFQSDLEVLNSDSIQATTIGTTASVITPLNTDVRGSWLQLAPDSRIFWWINRYPGTWGWMINLPDYLGSTQLQTDYFPSPQDTVAGLPNFCKRYHDSAPIWLGIPNVHAKQPVFGIWPNPVTDVAYFNVSGNTQPDRVAWVDAMGRTVRTDAVHAEVSTVQLYRGDLPHGLYVVEARSKGIALGRARVLVQ
ncbi:MAG: hypothetical protein ABI599_06680 [Flavobacteriales bacterium]